LVQSVVLVWVVLVQSSCFQQVSASSFSCENNRSSQKFSPLGVQERELLGHLLGEPRRLAALVRLHAQDDLNDGGLACGPAA
jgi:hypothetical protein